MVNNFSLTMSNTKMRTRPYYATYHQDGMALLTIMLMVVAITVVAGAMIASQGIMMRQYDLLKTQDQLLQNIIAGEQVAVDLIQVEAQINDTDSVEDAWAQSQPPFTLGKHDIIISIRDESSRFNVNNLYHDGKADMTALAVLQRLLVQLQLDESLALTLMDWQDPDSELSVGEGTETDLYAGEGVVIANQPFLSVDELGGVTGFDAEKLAIIKPHLTTVPYYLPINVNTANEILLDALVSNDDGSDQGNQSSQSSQNGQYDMAGIYDNNAEREIFTSVDEYLATLPQMNAGSGDGTDVGSDAGGESGDGSDAGAVDGQSDDSNEADDDKAGKDKEALARLLSVDSHAFSVLIDVAVDDKHRYATSYISKVAMPQNDSDNKTGDNGQTTQGQTTQGDASLNSGERVIQAFGTRLWTYRPSFD